MTDRPALTCTGVTKTFGTVIALAGVDLTVGRGRVHGLVGPNGAGKTTLLRMILGLVRPDAGTVRVLGTDPHGGEGGALDGVAGFVDAPRFYPYLTVGRTMALLADLDGDRAVDRIDAALEAVGLAALVHRRVGRLSTGQRQRLGLAGALIRAPHLLVVDEPTTGLDPAGIHDLHQLVRDLAADGRTVLLSSHDMTEVDRLCDDVTVVAAGRVAFDGPLSRLRDAAVVTTHRLRTSDDPLTRTVLHRRADLALGTGPDGTLEVVGTTDAVDHLVFDLAARGVAVRELVPTETALESEFTRLVGEVGMTTTAPAGIAGTTPVAARPGRRHDVASATRVELAKLAAQVRVRLALTACVLGPFAFALLVRLTRTLPSDTVFGRQVVDSAPAVALVALGFAGSWGLPVLVALVAGDIVSSEDHLGTWPTVLTRSRSRSAILTGKLVAATAYAVTAIALLALAAVAAGALLVGHGDLTGLSGQPITLGHATVLTLAAWASIVPAALAFGAIGLVVSVLSRNSLAGVAVPTALGLLVQLLGLVDGAQRVVALLPGASFLAWHGLFAQPSWTWPLWRGVLVAALWALAATAAARVVFRRRTAKGG